MGKKIELVSFDGQLWPIRSFRVANDVVINVCIHKHTRAVPAIPPKCRLAPPGGDMWCVVDVVGVASLKRPMRCPATTAIARCSNLKATWVVYIRLRWPSVKVINQKSPCEFFFSYIYIHTYKCINIYTYIFINNKWTLEKIDKDITLRGFTSMKFKFSLKSWNRKLVLELKLDIGKALNCWYDGV